MAITAQIRFARTVLRNFMCVHDWQFSRALAVARVSSRGLSVVGDSLRVHYLGISIPRQSSSIVQNIPDALLLRRKLGVRFCNAAEGIVATFGHFKIRITSGEEIFILREIFLHGVYNFGIQSKDIVVWDIGMNVGIASLYFAAHPCVRAVLGYEPFRPTFDAARLNFALNPGLASKITPRNCGIGAQATVTRAEYLSTWKGSIGVGGIREGVRNRPRLDGGEITVENVELAAADCVLRSILDDYPDCTIVAKIDCEGSEYEIIRCLDKKGLLGHLSAIMLEWHQRGPEELERALHHRGFVTYSQSSSDGIGMIYATKQGGARGVRSQVNAHGNFPTVPGSEEILS